MQFTVNECPALCHDVDLQSPDKISVVSCCSLSRQCSVSLTIFGSCKEGSKLPRSEFHQTKPFVPPPGPSQCRRDSCPLPLHIFGNLPQMAPRATVVDAQLLTRAVAKLSMASGEAVKKTLESIMGHISGSLTLCTVLRGSR